MKTFPKLYKRTNNGTVQQWQIFTDGDSYYTVEGLVDGKQTESQPSYCKGKNEGRANATTGEEQALKEAIAKFDKQLKKGYTEDITKIDTAKTFFEPMTCKKYQDRKGKFDPAKGFYVQPKLDGMRCVCTKDGMFSRYGNRILSAPHIREALEPWFKMYPDLIFDGELYTDVLKNDFDKIISLVRKTSEDSITPEMLAESKAAIEYWIYDLPSCKENFGKRYEELEMLFENDQPDCVVIVETHYETSQDMMDQWYEQWQKDGKEGQIIRLDAPYECKRTNSIIKRKEFFDDEFVILDVVEGEGNKVGWAATMSFKTKDGKPFDANVKGCAALVKGYWNNRKKLIGKKATVRYPNLTPEGKPRFPYVVAIRDYE